MLAALSVCIATPSQNIKAHVLPHPSVPPIHSPVSHRNMPSLKSLLHINSWSNKNKNSKRESPSPTPPSSSTSSPQNPNRLSTSSPPTGRRRISSSASQKHLSVQEGKANETEIETLEQRVARKSHDSQPLWRTPAKFAVSSGGVPAKGTGGGSGDGISSGGAETGSSGGDHGATAFVAAAGVVSGAI
jgi:hypothetical protein